MKTIACFCLFYFIISFNSISQTAVFDQLDVLVAPTNNITDAQSEPHLSVNKNHPDNMVISANYLSAPDFTQSVFVSDNYNNPTGGSWPILLRYDVFPNGAWNDPIGDPSTAYDTNGKLYVASINSGKDSYVLDISATFGSTWDPLVNPNVASGYFDKEMLAVDDLPGSPYVNYFYAAWTDYGAPNVPIMFNRSIDGGATFQAPIQISAFRGGGANVQSGPNGELYICWADYSPTQYLPATGIAFRKAIFQSSVTPVFFPETIAFSIAGITGGFVNHFNDTRVNDFPAMAVDRSCGNYRGRIYITCNELDPVITTMSRIKVMYSDDQGDTWYPCNSGNNSYGHVDIKTVPLYASQCWMPWIAVDDATGIVCVVYYSFDDSDPGEQYNTNTYMAYSDDGGNTFTNQQVSDVPHHHQEIPVPPPIDHFTSTGGYCGDYIAVDAYGGNAYVAWHDNRIPLADDQWNIYCSTEHFDMPALISSQGDLNLNAPMDPSNILRSVTYQAVNDIITTPNMEPFEIVSGSDYTFQAGNSIRFTPGFSSVIGSKTHAFISTNICAYSTPFRLADPVQQESGNGTDKSNEILVYPNPATTNIDVNYTIREDEKINLLLYNSFGQLIMHMVDDTFTEIGKYNVKVDMHGLPIGIYYLKLQTESKNYIKKISKL